MPNYLKRSPGNWYRKLQEQQERINYNVSLVSEAELSEKISRLRRIQEHKEEKKSKPWFLKFNTCKLVPWNPYANNNGNYSQSNLSQVKAISTNYGHCTLEYYVERIIYSKEAPTLNFSEGGKIN